MFEFKNTSWQIALKAEFEKPYFKNLQNKVIEAYKNSICYPPLEHVFSAFDFCDFNNLKVVIVGQDPYHGASEANGLAFSVNDGVKIPPSLRNIFKEINLDLDTIFDPVSGNLQRWAQQGVLLLNNTLTVQKDAPNSHKHLDWSVFTDAVIGIIAAEKEQVVFLLWGNFAHKKGSKIDEVKHLVLKCGHPSPMSANQGKWFGNKCFSETNIYLKRNNLQEIEW